MFLMLVFIPDLLTWLLVCRLVVSQYQRCMNLVKSILCGLGLSSSSSVLTLIPLAVLPAGDFQVIRCLVT